MTAIFQKIATDSFQCLYDLCTQAPDNTVLFFDIDDTVIYIWSHFFALKEGQGVSPGAAFLDEYKKSGSMDPEKLSAWRLARKIKLADDRWPQLLQVCQDQGHRTYGLTQMDPGPLGSIACTQIWRYKELKSLGIAFTPQSYSPEGLSNHFSFSACVSDYNATKSHTAENPEEKKSAEWAVGLIQNPGFYKGIYMTGAASKGAVMQKFLDHHAMYQQLPAHIIFADDREHHVDHVIEACSQRGISCTGVWFRAVHHVSYPPLNLDPNIALDAQMYDRLFERQKELFHEKAWKNDEEVMQELPSV